MEETPTRNTETEEEDLVVITRIVLSLDRIIDGLESSISELIRSRSEVETLRLICARIVNREGTKA